MKQSIRIFIIITFLMPMSEFIVAQEDRSNTDIYKSRKWYSPDYFKLQYAGNIGFLSIGLGYNWWREKAQSTFIYGYVPEHKGNTTIHTFSIKNDFKLYSFYINDKYNVQPILGFSVSLEPGQNSYMRVPDRFPDDYYGPNSFYACINLGLKTHFNFDPQRHFSGIDIYFEFNTLADYLYYNIIAQEDRSDNIGSLALGTNVFF